MLVVAFLIQQIHSPHRVAFLLTRLSHIYFSVVSSLMLPPPFPTLRYELTNIFNVGSSFSSFISIHTQCWQHPCINTVKKKKEKILAIWIEKQAFSRRLLRSVEFAFITYSFFVVDLHSNKPKILLCSFISRKLALSHGIPLMYTNEPYYSVILGNTATTFRQKWRKWILKDFW